jgi:hypothetical protein
MASDAVQVVRGVLCYPCADQVVGFGRCGGSNCDDWRCECPSHDLHGEIHKPGA